MIEGRGSRISLGSWDGIRWVRLRIGFLGLLLGVGLCIVLGRAFQLQVMEQERLSGMARDQYLRTAELAPHRGEILDRRGTRLAASVEVESIYVDPWLLGSTDGERRAAVAAVAKAAGLSPRQTQKLLERAMAPGNRFAWVKRKASPAVVARVQALGLGKGVATVRESRRFYPQKRLASQVLGFVGSDGRGLEGIERALDAELRGQSVELPALRDARGRRLFPEVAAPVEDRTGRTVRLTLDAGIQLVAERALERAMEESRARSGSVVVVDPQTGEILALAQAPDFNPNVVPGRSQQEAVRNRAVTDAFEPGSTMKAFLVAGALEQGKIRPDQTFDCEKGRWRIGRHVVHDTRPWDRLDAAGVLRVSSNICSGKIAQVLGGEALAAVYRDFGFGRRTGIELPGESAGLVGQIRSEIGLVTASFGQGPIMATPLQVAMAFAAIANGGELLEPWIVRSVVEPDGTVVRRGERKPIRRVVSERTARLVTRWLEEAVSEEGTGRKAWIDGYPVAGKTGTAQKVDPERGGYGKGRIASFAGFVPADDPRLVIVVTIDEPQQGSVYGGQVAAPVFKEVAEGALKLLGVPPTRPLLASAEVREKPATGRKAAPVEEAPAEGWVSVDGDEPPGPDQVRVPDLRGLFARSAVRALAEISLEADLLGTGRVVDQEPPAGSVVERGARVAITLQPL